MWRVVLLLLIGGGMFWVCTWGHMVLTAMAAELNAGRPPAEHLRLAYKEDALRVIDAYRNAHPGAPLLRTHRRLELSAVALFLAAVGVLFTAPHDAPPTPRNASAHSTN